MPTGSGNPPSVQVRAFPTAGRAGTALFPRECTDTSPSPLLPSTCLLGSRALSGRHRQRRGALWAPSHHASKQAPRQMALGQHPPVVTGMLHQPPARLHEPLLEACGPLVRRPEPLRKLTPEDLAEGRGQARRKKLFLDERSQFASLPVEGDTNWAAQGEAPGRAASRFDGSPWLGLRRGNFCESH